MIRLAKYLFLLMLTSSCMGDVEYEPCDADAESRVHELYSRLSELRNVGIMVGHQDDMMYGHDWAYRGGRSDVLESCGSYPAVMGWDLGGVETADSCNLDGVPFDRMREAVAYADSMGCIVTMSWHMRNPATGGNSWDLSAGNIVGELLPGGGHHDVYREWMGRCADFFRSLKDRDGEVVPVVFRPYHENTGGAFWWGMLTCEPEDYKALWRWTVEFMHEAGVHNLLWAYSTDIFKDAEGYMLRYPGDEWVDIMGWDAYHRPKDWDFVPGMRRMARTVADLAREHGKLAALTETGLESVYMDDWWTGSLLPSVRGFGLSYVLLWRNAHDMDNHFFAPFKGHSSEEDFRAFVAQDDILVLDDINI